MNLKQKRYESLPKWVSPCGNPEGYYIDDPLDDMNIKISMEELLTPAILTTEMAQNQVYQFHEQFVAQTFNSDYESFHKDWINARSSWLPKLPKSLGEPVPLTYLDNVQIEEALVSAYYIMQKYAVGLEQVVWDREEDDEEGRAFLKSFTDAELKLRAMLCELQVAIIMLGAKQKTDPSREDMPDTDRNTTGSSRDLRDWIILRDYMNGLEFILDVLKYFKIKSSS